MKSTQISSTTSWKLASEAALSHKNSTDTGQIKVRCNDKINAKSSYNLYSFAQQRFMSEPFYFQFKKTKTRKSALWQKMVPWWIKGKKNALSTTCSLPIIPAFHFWFVALIWQLTSVRDNRPLCVTMITPADTEGRTDGKTKSRLLLLDVSIVAAAL